MHQSNELFETSLRHERHIASPQPDMKLKSLSITAESFTLTRQRPFWPLRARQRATVTRVEDFTQMAAP